MILKCSAIAAHHTSVSHQEFSYAMTYKLYPLVLENEDEFKTDILELCRLNIIQECEHLDEDFDDELPEYMRKVYTYTNGFMRELIVSRMLEYQKKALDGKLKVVI